MFKQTLTAMGLAAASTLATAQPGMNFEVTITNLTPGQTFTPQLVVTHSRDYLMFRLGEPASEALEILAEGGDTAPLVEEIGDLATEATTIDGLLGPGETTSVVVSGNPGRDFISVAAMLIPTNDNFVALNRVKLPRASAAYLVPAYDAGTEANDQNCLNIPGPLCGGEGYSPEPAEGDEGFVHIGNGFHELEGVGVDDDILGPQGYDWRNPVARITVRRMSR